MNQHVEDPHVPHQAAALRRGPPDLRSDHGWARRPPAGGTRPRYDAELPAGVHDPPAAAGRPVALLVRAERLGPARGRPARSRRGGPAGTGAQLVAAKDYAAALPLLSPTSLNGTPLANYAAYYIGVAQIGLARYDEALLVLSLLAAKPLDGALKELVPLRMGEAALALNMADRAEGALVELSADKLAEPGAVWLMRARVEDAANHRAHALEAYRRLYYDHPLTAEAAEAPAALSRLQAAGEVSAETDRALARAERLFAARRWADARTAFVALQSGVSGDARAGVALRIAECDYYLNNRRAAREALASMFERPTRGRSPLLPPAGDQGAGPAGVRAAGAQAGGGVSRDAVGRAGAERAGHAARHARPGRRGGRRVPPADARAIPKSPYAERAAWKVGWRAYRRGDFQETVERVRVRGRQLPARRQPPGVALLGRPRARAAGRRGHGERPLPSGGGGLPELLLRPAGVGHPEGRRRRRRCWRASARRRR